MRSLLAVLFLGASTLGACTLPGSHYDPSPDAPHPPDAPQPDTQPARPLLMVTPVSTTIDEGGSAPVMVSLSAKPDGAFFVAIHSNDVSVATSLPTLTFNEANYALPQVVMLTAVQDTNAISEHASVVVSGPGDTLPVGIDVNVVDDDALAIVVSTTTLTVTEGGSSMLQLHLSAMPAGDVIVTAVPASGAVAVAPTSVVFTPSNYASDQVLTVSAPQDANTTDEDVAVTLHASAPGVADATITVHVLDKDVQNIMATPTMMTIVEGGTPGTLQVALTKMPSSNVTVNASSAIGEVQLSTPSLTFTPANYNVPQTISVTAIEDTNTVDESTHITLSSVGLNQQMVTVTVQDDDVQKIIESAPPSITITEGQTTTFTVSLAFAPSGTVVINASSANGNVTLAPATLVFNASNYSTPKTITVTAPLDPDTVTDQDTITLSGVIVAPVSIPVTVVDTTDLAIALSKSVLTIDEGTSQTFTISLTAQPPANLTVTVASADTAVATVAPPTLTFTPSNWNTPQVVTVTVPHDANTTDETTLVTVSASGLASKSIQVNTHDTGP